MAGRTPLKRVRVSVEPNGSYALDRTGTIGNFYDVRFNSASLQKPRQVLPDESTVQRLRKRRQVFKGFKSATLDLSGYLTPLAVELASGATPVQDGVSYMLESMLGVGRSADQGDAVAASPSPTTTVFTVTDGTSFAAGQLVLVETTASSEVYELNKIKAISTNALTFCWAFSFTPASTAKVLNMENFYPTQFLPSVTTSLQFLIEGEDRDSIWAALGCQAPLALEWPLGGMPTWSGSFMGATWIHDDELGTPQGGSALAAATTTNWGTPVPVTSGSVVLSAISGTARTLPTVAEVALNLGLSWTPYDSYNGVEGKAAMVGVRGEQATCTMLVLSDSEEWEDAFANGTKYRIAQQAGNLGAGSVAWCMPTVELIAEPVIEDRNGIEWRRLTFGALENEDVTGSTDLALADFVIGRG